MDEKLVNKFWTDAFAAGALVWAAGFVVTMALWSMVSKEVLGWIALPFVLGAAVWASYVRLRKPGESLLHCAGVALIWVALAYVLDYLLIVRGFKAQGFYDLDAVLSYAGLLLIPIALARPRPVMKAGQPRAA